MSTLPGIEIYAPCDPGRGRACDPYDSRKSATELSAAKQGRRALLAHDGTG